MNILVLNCGSSSLKLQIITTDNQAIDSNTGICRFKGHVETVKTGRTGELQNQFKYDVPGQPTVKTTAAIEDLEHSIETVLEWIFSEKSNIEELNDYSDIHAVGHRVVHGGEHFKQSTLINQTVLETIEECVDLAPLHNLANLQGIKHMLALLGPDIPQVAVFDTAFHAQMPQHAFLYGLPYDYYQRYKIRRYGFHGTSHRYVSRQYRALTGFSKKRTHIISLHLGNGCSACAIQAGVSIDTSMGFTPLEGLLMGTRSGDLDPSILAFLHDREAMSFDQLEVMLNKKSGLLGISGLTSDMRTLLETEAEDPDTRAGLAIDMFCRRVCKYVASYYVAMQGKVAALVFTAGIGENSAQIRQRICTSLECLGVLIDTKLNTAANNPMGDKISSKDSRLEVYVIPTNEESMIARDTAQYLNLTAPE